MTTARADGVIVGTLWRHAVEPAGHQVEPVPELETVGVQGLCDFCGVAAPSSEAWLYPTRPVASGIADGRGSQLVLNGDAWLGCGQCSAIIETGLVGRLTARCASVAVGRAPAGEDYSEIFELLLPLFEEFTRSRSGARYRPEGPGTS